ncbi:hypothetical protein BGX26_010415 [Mortierella sp. AD094]|nr:hypothetical protein BGX26_010415 [Mortierella sp. AD094]
MGYIRDKYHKHFCKTESKEKALNEHFKSFTVTVFSVFAFIFAGLNILAIEQTGVEDSLFKDMAYVITGLLVTLSIVGLYSIHYPSKSRLRQVLVACWVIAAFAVTGLSVWEMDMLLTTKKTEARGVCQRNFLLYIDKFNGHSGSYDPKDLADGVDKCYVFVAIAAATELSFQVMATIFGVVYAKRYHKRTTRIPKASKSQATSTLREEYA